MTSDGALDPDGPAPYSISGNGPVSHVGINRNRNPPIDFRPFPIPVNLPNQEVPL